MVHPTVLTCKVCRDVSASKLAATLQYNDVIILQLKEKKKKEKKVQPQSLNTGPVASLGWSVWTNLTTYYLSRGPKYTFFKNRISISVISKIRYYHWKLLLCIFCFVKIIARRILSLFFKFNWLINRFKVWYKTGKDFFSSNYLSHLYICDAASVI